MVVVSVPFLFKLRNYLFLHGCAGGRIAVDDRCNAGCPIQRLYKLCSKMRRFVQTKGMMMPRQIVDRATVLGPLCRQCTWEFQVIKKGRVLEYSSLDCQKQNSAVVMQRLILDVWKLQTRSEHKTRQDCRTSTRNNEMTSLFPATQSKQTVIVSRRICVIRAPGR